ncbi:MAG: PhoH family protein, partial [Pseudomonadota bacterium]
MGIGELTTASFPPNSTETMVEYPDNRLMIDLCGVFDRNLAQIETLLCVQIARRGNQLIITGEPDACAKTAEVCDELYHRLEAGKTVDTPVIEATIRMGAAPAESESVGQLEMFDRQALEIKTRKKTVEPRTAKQRAYAKALFGNELVFGIGPAGTGKTYIAVAVAVNMFVNGHV